MLYFLTVVHVLLCVFMIFVILLQPGKDAGMGAALGGGAATSAFGGRGAVTFLSLLPHLLGPVLPGDEDVGGGPRSGAGTGSGVAGRSQQGATGGRRPPAASGPRGRPEVASGKHCLPASASLR
jgi:preprotein translocase subunit SecG